MNVDNAANDIVHCKYYVVRKKRFCRMTVKAGFDFCGEHEPKSTTEADPRLRIPCPLDSKHTCFASKLAKHLKKCNAQMIPSEPYLSKNINFEEDIMEIRGYKRALSKAPASKILEIITKINVLYEDIIASEISNKILNHDILTEEISKPEYGNTSRKHLMQTSSIIEHLNQADLLNPKTCYVEFGAGKGQLSYWLSKIIQPFQNSSVLLVERASLRHKMDNKLDKSNNISHRIRADIADLVLGEVDVVKQSEKVVGVTKHLCGDATDLALKCLVNGQKINVQGLVMAFCCHHRCHWSNYTGKQFFEIHGLNREDFDIICGLVSWATCGSGLSREARKNRSQNQDSDETIVKVDEIGLSREERALVGKKCKHLIDYGRMYYLQSNKFTCNLYYYVDENVTLENVCIVAKKE